MEIRAVTFGIKSITIKSFKWSIGISLIFYVTIFILVKIFRIPLKGDGKLLKYSHSHRNNETTPKIYNNIVDYLHKLHNVKKIQEIHASEKELMQSFYTVEEVFKK